MGLELVKTKEQVGVASYVKALSFRTKGRGSKERRQHLAPLSLFLSLKMLEIDLDYDFSSFLPKEINYRLKCAADPEPFPREA